MTTAEGPIGWTAVKRQEQTNHLVVRGFNLTAQNIPCELHKETQPATCLTNVLEEPLTPAIEVDAPLRPFEIRHGVSKIINRRTLLKRTKFSYFLSVVFEIFIIKI